MATGQHKNWTCGRSVIGWSAAGFVAINIVAVNSLTGSRPSGHTHAHNWKWPDRTSKGPSDSLTDRLSLAKLIP